MLNKMAAVLIMLMMCLAAGNASAKTGGKKMMDCKGKCGEEKGMMMKDGGMADRFPRMVEMLGLDPEQKKAVETIHFTHSKEVIRKEADIDVAEIELREIIGKEPVNVEEAEKQIRTIAALRADLDIMHLKTKEAIKTKLTPEQLVKFKKHLAAEMMERIEDKGGMGKDGCKMGGMGKDGCKMDGKMGGKTKKCNMMGDEAGAMKASTAEVAPPEAMAEKMKAEHSHHH